MGNFALMPEHLRVCLISLSHYTPNKNTDSTMEDIPKKAILSDAELSGVTVSPGGTLDAADITFPNVSGPDVIDALLLYQDGGSPDKSIPIAYIDSNLGLPITPNGGNITINWNNGKDKIFTLDGLHGTNSVEAEDPEPETPEWLENGDLPS